MTDVLLDFLVQSKEMFVQLASEHKMHLAKREEVFTHTQGRNQVVVHRPWLVCKCGFTARLDPDYVVDWERYRAEVLLATPPRNLLREAEITHLIDMTHE